MATEETWKKILCTNYTDLLTNIDSKYEFYGELKKANIFTPIALKSYMEYSDTTKGKHHMLIDLQKKDFESFKKFCEVLKNSHQEHVVRDHLSQVKIRDIPIYPDTATHSPTNLDKSRDRPISRGMSQCLKSSWNDLVYYITFDAGLLGQVEEREILTKIQLDTLRDMTLKSDRTRDMLSWLERGSEKQFLGFCDALKANNQQHIVEQYLEHNKPEREIPETVPKNPEGASICSVAPFSVPVPIALTASDICFVRCTPEFLNSVQTKVQQKIAYRCESKPRGRALIMNNTFFCVDRLTPREGSEVDTVNLQKLFNLLHFDTVVHSNQDAEEMWEILEKESRAEHHKQYDMFVVFLLSHGVRGEIFGSDGKSLKIAEIVNLFNGKSCPGLLTKPKLFFIQACQGEIKTAGVSLADAGMTDCDSAEPVQHQDDVTLTKMMTKLRLMDDFNVPIVLLPNVESDMQCDAIADGNIHEMADIAITYATVEGYVAWRRRDTGSLFVQCLINALKKEAHEADLMDIITKAFNMLNELEVNGNQDRYKQIGEKRDSLRRKVYLLP